MGYSSFCARALQSRTVFQESNMDSPQPLKLFLASAHFFPTHGGAQLRYLRYIPGLRQRGIHTSVLCGTPKSKKDERANGNNRDLPFRDHEFLSDEIPDKLPIHRVKLPDSPGWRRSITFNQAILRYCTQPRYRPDIIQLVSSLKPGSIFWMHRLRKLGAAMVYAYTLPMQLPSNSLKRFIRRLTLQQLYNSMDCIIVNSTQMQEQMSHLGIKVRLEFIPNGVDLQRFRPPSSAEERRSGRESLGIEPNQLVITTVGAVHPRKGTDLLLEGWVNLAKRFANARLFVVGLRKDLTYPNLRQFRQRLQELIAQSGAPERVHFTGLIRNVEDYLRASDVFAFPSAREGMPNVVLEAMASGLPVVLTPFDGLSAELGRAGEEYLLVERRVDALVKAISGLLENLQLRENYGKKARNWVQKHLDIERTLDRYAHLYHELANELRHE